MSVVTPDRLTATNQVRCHFKPAGGPIALESARQSQRGARILIVEDDVALRRGIKAILVGQGYDVDTAEDGEEAIDTYRRRRPDVVLLDLGLPGKDGFEVIGEIRTQSPTPILVLSMLGADSDKVRALDLGADDFINKPFSVDELLARIRVGLRHAANPRHGAAAVFRTGDLEVDLERRLVMVSGREVKLRPTEYQLLKAFIGHPNKVLTHGMLLRQVWGPTYGPESSHYLHVYVASLRKKLEKNPQEPELLVTEPGIGYRLRA